MRSKLQQTKLKNVPAKKAGWGCEENWVHQRREVDTGGGNGAGSSYI